jgi:hypothetical protein
VGPTTGLVVDVNPLIGLWAHPRSVSTAFVRMMMERGDVTVVHEPLVHLTDFGAVTMPDGCGGRTTATDPAAVFAAMRAAATVRPVFFKDTLEYRYDYLFEHADQMRGITHTFIIRDPVRTINSHRAIKADVSCSDIGFEHQWQLFELAWSATGQRPLVVSAERLLAEPAAVVAAYCSAVGLPFLPHALHWRPEDRAEFGPNRKWHLDAIASAGFTAPAKDFAVTVDTDPVLRGYLDHHRPFYERLHQYAI